MLAPLLMVAPGMASAQGQDPTARHQQAGQASAQQVIEEWPETSRKVAEEMIDTYGEPDGVMDSMVVWHDNGPWVRTIVHKEEIEHNFPRPHQDVLEQFITYEVPEDKFSDLARYDGSVVAYRTNGEMSARCDKEAANILALNLAHDIIEDERDVEGARAFYAQTVQQLMQGEQPEYVRDLHFEVQAASVTADPDEPFEATEQVAGAGPQGESRQAGEDVASLPAAELAGKDVLSAEGEVVGQITEVVDSEQQGEQLARVDVGGFFGIGARTIELPLSDLSLTAEGNVQTQRTREELEDLPDVGGDTM